MRFLPFFLLLSLPLLAAPTKKEAPRTLRTLLLGHTANLQEEVFLFDGVKTQEIKFPRMNFSQIYEISTGNRTLYLLKSPPVEGEEIDPNTPSVKISSATKDAYLLASPDPQNKIIPLSLQVVDVSDDKLRTGEMLWFNLTDHFVGGRLGTQTLKMTPQSRVIVKRPTKPREFDYAVQLSYLQKGQKQAYPICDTRWNFNPNGRTLFFVTNDEGRSVPKVFGFLDDRIPKEEKKQ